MALIEAALAGTPIDAWLSSPRHLAGGFRASGGLGFFALGLGFLVVAASTRLSAAPREAKEATAVETTLPLVPAAAGGLRVLARPWAEVWVDGVAVETTPFARPIPLAKGPHFVVLRHPDAPPTERTIEVVEGQTIVLEVILPLPEEPQAPVAIPADAGTDAP
jgi:serine/threonine-protein kinase